MQSLWKRENIDLIKQFNAFILEFMHHSTHRIFTQIIKRAVANRNEKERAEQKPVPTQENDYVTGFLFRLRKFIRKQ